LHTRAAQARGDSVRLGLAPGDGAGIHAARSAQRRAQPFLRGKVSLPAGAATLGRLQQLLETRRPAPGIAGLEQGDQGFGPELRAGVDLFAVAQNQHGQIARVCGRAQAGAHVTQRALGRSARKRLPASQDECAKCGSTYVFREPAFLHCRCCGSLARIPNGSLADQQLFELRSGLRLAS